MRFLANENVPRAAVMALRAAGHAVAWIRLDAPGASDREVLALASSENRVLITFDKDFGDLARNAGLSDGCGVVLFRLPMPSPATAGAAIADILTSRDDWPGHFAVVEPGRIRLRRLR